MAKIFLDSNDIYTSATSNTTIYGGTGSERIILQSGVLGTLLDQNVEQVALSAGSTSYKYQQSGNQLWIYDKDTLVAKITVQEDGTDLQFSDGTFAATLAAGKMLVGNQTVATSPATLGSVATSSGTLLAQASAKSTSILGYDKLLPSSSSIVQALVAGESVKWNSPALTYSFNTMVPSDYTDIGAYTNNWSALNTSERAAVRSAFQKAAEIIPLTFTEVGGTGDFRFNVVDQASAGFAVAPVNTPFSAGVDGDVFLATGNRLAGAQYSYLAGDAGYLTVLHEIGHAVGLKHPFEAFSLPTQLDNYYNSIMSYTEVRNAVLTFTKTATGASYSYNYTAMPDSYAAYDIAALQALYGPNSKTRIGDNTYSVSSHSYDYLCIWDAGGTDSIDASSSTGVCIIDLNEGNHSTIDFWPLTDQKTATKSNLSQQGFYNDAWIDHSYDQYANSLYTGENNLSIAYGVVIENVTTGSANDKITDNKVDNIISTRSGDDTITLGHGGFDTVDGGDGIDTVILLGITKSQVLQEKQSDGSLALVTPGFAAKLIGIETVNCTDGPLKLLISS